jgi:hypothetical protein
MHHQLNSYIMKTKAIISYLAFFVISTSFGQTWQKLNSFSSTGRYTKAFVINNEGYIVGGGTAAGATNECWKYIVQKDSWKQMANVPISANYFNTFSIGSTGYAFYDSALFAYNPTTNSWSRKKGLYYSGINFWNCPVFVIGNLAYMIGADKRVYSYDPNTNMWSRKSDFPGLSRNSYVAVSIKGKGYVSTGLNASSAGNKVLNDMWEYDPAADKWTQKANYPSTPRYASFGFTDGTLTYLIGGESLNPTTTNKDVYSYDPVLDKYTKLTDFLGGNRNYIVGFYINGTVFCGMGGLYYNKDFYKMGILSNKNGNCELISKVCVSVNPKNEEMLFAGVPNRTKKSYSPNGNLPLNSWSHLAFVKRDSNVYIYKNGLLVDSNVYTKQTYAWSSLVLGAALFGGKYNAPFKGWIDDFRYSNQTRTSTEIFNNYNSGIPSVADTKTVGIWDFDSLNISTGKFGFKYGGVGGTASKVTLTNGRYGKSFYYNGKDAHADIARSINVPNYSVEFWIKPDSMGGSWPVCFYGINTDGVGISSAKSYTKYKWSTGDTGLTTCFNPNTTSFVTVTDGSCEDTLYTAWNKASVTIYDTVRTKLYDTIRVSVTDTLFVNVKFNSSGGEKMSLLKIYPNPTNSNLNLDFSDYNSINGYSIVIRTIGGQVVYNASVTKSFESIDLSTFLGKGTYLIEIKDKSGKYAAEIKKIILR